MLFTVRSEVIESQAVVLMDDSKPQCTEEEFSIINNLSFTHRFHVKSQYLFLQVLNHHF